MPKTSRSAEEVAQVREHILSAAIGIGAGPRPGNHL
jgi:hypothetical protein